MNMFLRHKRILYVLTISGIASSITFFITSQTKTCEPNLSIVLEQRENMHSDTHTNTHVLNTPKNLTDRKEIQARERKNLHLTNTTTPVRDKGVRNVTTTEKGEKKNSEHSTGVSYNVYIDTIVQKNVYDKFIQVVMSPSKNCGNTSMYDAVMAVHSAPAHFEKRKTFRWLYGDQNKTHPYKIKLLFFIGTVLDPALQANLSQELHEFSDLVQGSFIDSYHNLTYKAIFLFHWLDTNCRGLKLLLRVDDDIFFIAQRFFPFWTKTPKHRFIGCEVMTNDLVRRNGKWGVPVSLVAEKRYNFSRCLGYFTAVTPDLVHEMSEAARSMPFYWIDDVFMYGFVPKRLQVKLENIRAGMMRKKMEDFVKCVETKGKNCPIWVLLADYQKLHYLYELINK